MEKKLQILKIKDTEKNKDVNLLVLNNEVFDWGLDQDSLNRAKKLIEQKPDMKESVIMSILNHFSECFSDFLGRKTNLEEILNSIEKGIIQ